jgi:hypothetical protein
MNLDSERWWIVNEAGVDLAKLEGFFLKVDGEMGDGWVYTVENGVGLKRRLTREEMATCSMLGVPAKPAEEPTKLRGFDKLNREYNQNFTPSAAPVSQEPVHPLPRVRTRPR